MFGEKEKGRRWRRKERKKEKKKGKQEGREEKFGIIKLKYGFKTVSKFQ